jgi:hypothetical protein
MLRVTALDQHRASAEFLADVLGLLSAHARASALELTFRAVPASSSSFVAEVPSGAAPIVRRFCGIHRAQVAPTEAPLGRVVTVRVAVDCVEPGDNRALDAKGWPVVFTYSYLIGVVTEHMTGQQHPLRAFLEGRLR